MVWAARLQRAGQGVDGSRQAQARGGGGAGVHCTARRSCTIGTGDRAALSWGGGTEQGSQPSNVCCQTTCVLVAPHFTFPTTSGPSATAIADGCKTRAVAR